MSADIAADFSRDLRHDNLKYCALGTEMVVKPSDGNICFLADVLNRYVVIALFLKQRQSCFCNFLFGTVGLFLAI